ncbi:triose-phosphate isomerase [Peptoniphilus stercorisuis]|uniref:Triosephosphate isomerase n=1 Tax=Peptoniphilus stercorisuis TaxID=1436965 RepID=A0ABS4KDP3_9FIRM|nr:triose-phosphate isomerase [Peptoniphilus stercorisuis]MBP2025882.1 triosephosphate isomerase [Peptoniphilus stercorisuis]
MRKPLIAGNWKMNLNVTDTKEMLNELVKMDLDNKVDALICPTFTSLYPAMEILKDSNVLLGAQNVSEYEDGARTGEISTNMLRDLDVKYIILGHSERRTYYNESNEIVNAKIKRAIDEDFVAILCVGEEEKDREENNHEKVVENQLRKSLKDIEDYKKVVVAYEPIWAIGTGKTCNPEDAEKMCLFIREILSDIFDKEKSNEIRILYGGSVKPANVKELMQNENIDGALVGGASLKAEDFRDLVNFGE